MRSRCFDQLEDETTLPVGKSRHGGGHITKLQA